MLNGTHDRIPDSCLQSTIDRSKWTIMVQPSNYRLSNERGVARRGGRSRACEIKNHDDDAIDRLFRAANRYSYRACAYRGMLFPRSDTKYITARRTTWTDRTLELETWVIKVPKDNWPVSKGDSRPEDLLRKMSVYRPELQVNYAYEGGISGPYIE